MKKTGLYALLIAVALAADGALAQGVAFITDLKGDAALGSVKPALMAELGKGARIVCVKDCQVGVMYLVSGKEFMLKGPGDFVVGEFEVTAKIGPPPAVRETDWKLSSQTVSQAVQTSNASIRMRSLGNAVAAMPDARVEAAQRLLYPVETGVPSLQPAFRWSADNVRGPYDFELKADAAAGKAVYKTKVMGEARLKLPASVKLQPDSAYTWSVKMGGREIGTGGFRTLSAASIELAQRRKPADAAGFSDRLLYGLTLRELGAAQDAADVFAKLAQERADNPELAALAK